MLENVPFFQKNKLKKIFLNQKLIVDLFAVIL